MRLNQIEAQQCGAVAGLRIEGLQPGLNVILGPNGCGKTSLLRFVRDLLADSRTAPDRQLPAMPAAGAIDIESGCGEVRVIRLPRTGHRDTVAVSTTNAQAAQQFRAVVAVDRTTSSLLNFVDSADVHQAPALAELATQVTDRLCAEELGDSWALVCAPSGIGLAARVPATAVLLRLATFADDAPESAIVCDPVVIESNWRTVIAGLEQQREQRALEHEARVRMQVRRQREATTRMRWLGERVAELESEIAGLDADWQAAECDAAERALHCYVPAPATMAERGDPRVQRLRAVMSDLAADRLDILLQMGCCSDDPQSPLAEELRRIESCERVVLAQMQWRLQGRRGTETVCTKCGERPAAASIDTAAPLGTSLAPHRSAVELRQRLFAARSQLAAACRQLERLRTQQRRRALDPSIDRARYDVQILDAQISELRGRQAAEIAASAIATRYAVRRRHDVLTLAGAYLSDLTTGRYLRLQRDDDDGELICCDTGGSPLPVVRLSRGAREQVSMALRLALFRALAQLGGTGPILWDEPLADSDEQRLDAAASLLMSYATEHSQLLLFTCREHVARALEARGACLHTIGGPGADRIGQANAGATPEFSGQTLDRLRSGESPSGVRVHPSSTYWLYGDAPLEHVPSLSPQFARRLRSLGMTDVQQLLDYEPPADPDGLVELQMSRAQVQIWQAEARLLTEVPGLTGRDAQTLVSSGLFSRLDLAQADVDDLTRRIDRLRGGESLRWRMGPSTSPHRETIERWIENARSAPPADPLTRHGAAAGRSPTRRVRRHRSAQAPIVSGPPVVASRFRLQPDSAIVDAPSIGQRTAKRLERIGIITVRDLLTCDPQQTAQRLRHYRITMETVRAWQQQAGLMCSVPDLRCADAIVLVACGISGPLDLRRISPAALQSMVMPFSSGVTGRRLLRGATPPTSEDIARWIDTVEESRIRRAA